MKNNSKNNINYQSIESFWEHRKPREVKGSFTTKDAAIKNRFDFAEDEEIVVRNIKWKRGDNF